MKLYVARDNDGSIYLYSEKPQKENIGVWGVYGGIVFPLEKVSFPEVTWEDAEPTEVELVIKKQYDSKRTKTTSY